MRYEVHHVPVSPPYPVQPVKQQLSQTDKTLIFEDKEHKSSEHVIKHSTQPCRLRRMKA